MRRETCQGTGKIGPLPIPCSDCGGSGWGYCCSGSDVDCAVEQIIVSPEAYDEIVAALTAPAVLSQCAIEGAEFLRRVAVPRGTESQ